MRKVCLAWQGSAAKVIAQAGKPSVQGVVWMSRPARPIAGLATTPAQVQRPVKRPLASVQAAKWIAGERASIRLPMESIVADVTRFALHKKSAPAASVPSIAQLSR